MYTTETKHIPVFECTLLAFPIVQDQLLPAEIFFSRVPQQGQHRLFEALHRILPELLVAVPKALGFVVLC